MSTVCFSSDQALAALGKVASSIKATPKASDFYTLCNIKKYFEGYIKSQDVLVAGLLEKNRALSDELEAMAPKRIVESKFNPWDAAKATSNSG